MTWRERVGIEPTSRLAAASAILKTVRATRPVRSHDGEKLYSASVSTHEAPIGEGGSPLLKTFRSPSAIIWRESDAVESREL